MWNRTSLRPVDVDVAGLYDGFSILTVMWLAAWGSANGGESGAFVEGGGRISLGGELPLNTPGGPVVGWTASRPRFPARGVPPAAGRGGRAPGARSQPVGVVALGAQPGVGCVLLRSHDA